MASTIDSLEKYKDCISLLFEALNKSWFSKTKLQFAQHTSLLNQLLTKLAKWNEEDKTPLVIEIIGTFIEYVDYGQLKLIAQKIKKSILFTRIDKIIVLEFIGAALINILENFAFALMCWKEALTYRFFSQDGEPLPKQLAECAPSTASFVVFGKAVEFMTIEHLKSLQEDFERHYLTNTDLLLRHFLPCTRRILP